MTQDDAQGRASTAPYQCTWRASASSFLFSGERRCHSAAMQRALPIDSVEKLPSAGFRAISEGSYPLPSDGKSLFIRDFFEADFLLSAWLHEKTEFFNRIDRLRPFPTSIVGLVNWNRDRLLWVALCRWCPAQSGQERTSAARTIAAPRCPHHQERLQGQQFWGLQHFSQMPHHATKPRLLRRHIHSSLPLELSP